MIMVTRGANKAHSVTIHRTGAERGLENQTLEQLEIKTTLLTKVFQHSSPVSKFGSRSLSQKINQSSQQCGFHSGVVFNVVLTVEWNVFSINSPSRCGSQVIY